MRARLIILASLACAAVALSALADPPRRRIDAGRALDAGARSTPDIVVTPTPADPPPLVERQQWVFDLRWERGDVWLLGVHALDLRAPQATPRVMGRFAIELFEGTALIERVRFDFPLLGVPEPEDAGNTPSLTKKLSTRVGVVFPATTRGTRLELWDRATNRRWSLPWPPQSESTDAGVRERDGGEAGK
jgi:hypothetical protein